MMLYPAMKDLLEKVPSRYELVNVVACKARQIAREAEMAGEPLDEKPVSIAIQAVADGKLNEENEGAEQAEA
ncbi:MAG: DNA-directed RNA polymerase subunit omega [Lawsonibacter sp.]|nr:DNA-directed RNA polymerase subunit omega [Lawsonibacter sp.]